MLKTTRPKVYDPNLRTQGMGKEDILGFQVAVDDLLAVKKNQGTEELLGKPADELQRKPSEIVCLDEFIKVHTEELSRYAKVASEIKALSEVDHAMPPMRILISCIQPLFRRSVESICAYPFLKPLENIYLN
jgi:hypothetical protein